MNYRYPRYMRNFNALGARVGVKIRMGVEGCTMPANPKDYANRPQHILAVWDGTLTQFCSLDFLTRSQRGLLHAFGKCILTIPKGGDERSWTATGRATVKGRQVRWEIDFGEVPNYVQERRGVEVVEYDERTLYHGTAEALIAAGIQRTRIPLGARRSKVFRSITERQWWCRRQPDGLYVYCTDTVEVWQATKLRWERWELEQRAAAATTTAPSVSRERRSPVPTVTTPRSRPPFLRLVVDNTRPGGAA